MTISKLAAQSKPRLVLAMSIAIIVFVWTCVLPAIGTHPAVARHIQMQQQLNINPSALFYTELEESHEIAHRIERLQQMHTMSWNAQDSH